MERHDRQGLIGGIAAVALIAHLWMLPAYDSSVPPHHDGTVAAVVITTDTLPMAACPVGMSACTATGVDELRLALVAAITTPPALLRVLHVLRRRASSLRRTRTAHDPGPPQSPVAQRVLLLE